VPDRRFVTVVSHSLPERLESQPFRGRLFSPDLRAAGTNGSLLNNELPEKKQAFLA
jgi:hypothetical protein